MITGHQNIVTLVFTNVTAEVEKVTDIHQIVQRGVMSTPALVIDGKVVLQGKNPTVDQLKELLGAR